MTGLEPAGGWTVRVHIMVAMARPAAIATDHQCGPRSVMQISPISELIKWPPITFLGCENGESGKPKIRTQEAPKEPRTSAVSSDCASHAMMPIANVPPNPARMMGLRSGFGGKGVRSPASFCKNMLPPSVVCVDRLVYVA